LDNLWGEKNLLLGESKIMPFRGALAKKSSLAKSREGNSKGIVEIENGSELKGEVGLNHIKENEPSDEVGEEKGKYLESGVYGAKG